MLGRSPNTAGLVHAMKFFDRLHRGPFTDHISSCLRKGRRSRVLLLDVLREQSLKAASTMHPLPDCRIPGRPSLGRRSQTAGPGRVITSDL